MAKKKNKKEMVVCPIGKFFMDFEKVWGMESDFFKHLTQSRIEFLRAIRSVVDERIETLEKKHAAKSGKKMTKIKVE